MKKLFFILTVFIFFSCENDPITVENPEKETTLEIVNLSKKDSTTYKVVELDNTLHVLQNEKVVKKVYNNLGAVGTLLIIIIILFFLSMFLI